MASLVKRVWAPLTIFVAWRAATHLLVLLSAAYFPDELGHPEGYPAHFLLERWVRWDARWYLQIAESGYWQSAGHSFQSYAFFPLYPLVTNLVFRVVGDVSISSFFVSNLCFVAALVVLHLYVEKRFGHDTTRRTVLLVISTPFAVFFGAPYTESMFLLLAVSTFWLGERGRWWTSGLVGALCAATRLVGVALLPALGLLYLQDIRSGLRRVDARALAPFLVLTGTGAFAVYLWAAFGDPLAFYRASALGWGRYHPLRHGWDQLNFLAWLPSFDEPIHYLNLLALLIGAALVPVIWRRLGPCHALFVVIGIAVPLSAGLESIGRYVSVLFPCFIAAAHLLRNRVALGLAVGIGALLQGFASILFTHWYRLI